MSSDESHRLEEVIQLRQSIMQRFLISVILAIIISWVLLLIYAAKINEAGILPDLIFSALLFLAVSLTLALIFYWLRILISKIASGQRLKTEEKEFVDLRPVFRRSFKMATVIAAFLAILSFLKLEDLLNLFNFSILLAIIVLGSIWLRS